jgi:hypothetical protein
MSTTAVETDELDTGDWEAMRSAVTQRFLGMTAAQFVEAFRRGDFDTDERADVMTVLALFPELDG